MGEREETGRRLNRSGAALGDTDIHGDEPFKPRHHPRSSYKNTRLLWRGKPNPQQSIAIHNRARHETQPAGEMACVRAASNLCEYHIPNHVFLPSLSG